MKFLEKCVDRPLPVFLIAGLVVLLGALCLFELPVKRTPDVEVPFSLVVVPYQGAAPEDVESEVTIELEEELNSLEGLRHLTSVSGEGLSTHLLEFEDRADMTESLRNVQDKVQLAEVEFPAGADLAVVRELSFENAPIIFFTLSGGVGLFELRAIAEDLRPSLESVAGVNRVEIFGGFEREVQIRVDPIALAEHDLTLTELVEQLRRQGTTLPAGELVSSASERLIRATGEFRSLEEIRSIPVVSESTGTLVLGDVARVRVDHERLSSSAWFDGEPSVTLIVRRRSGVNTLDTVARLERKVDVLRPQLPPGVQIDATSDAAEDIGAMIRQLGTSAVLGMLLVVGVLLVMFGASQALLVASVLPFSLLFTFLGLYIFDMEISNIALFSVVLVLGLVVDGAIIVGEAIYREREDGASATDAAKAGLGRVGLPVFAADLTTVAAFVPMLLMVGLMGQFMSVMPKVVVFALIGSIFVDHMLLPAAASKLPRRPPPRKRRLAPDGLPWFSPELPRARRQYMRLLDVALRQRQSVVVFSAAAFAGALLLFGSGAIESIFLPTADRGRVTLNYALPLGTGLGETNRVGRLIEREIQQLPEVESYVLTTGETGALNSDNREGGRSGPEYGRFSIELGDPSGRQRSQSEVARELRERTAHLAGVEIDLEELQEGPPTGAALAIRVQGESLEQLADVAARVKARVADLEGSADVRVDYDRSKPQIRVALDRPRAKAEFGISPDLVSRSLATAFNGVVVGRMWVAGERVDIRLQAPESYAHSLDHVRELPLRAASGGIVPLAEVAHVELAFAHDAIFRYDTRRAVTVRADTTTGYSSVRLGTVAREALSELPLPLGVSLEYGGETEERDRSYASLWSALKWGVLLIFIIMAIQFNSLSQPLIVLLSVPLSIVGVTLALVLTGIPFSFMVFIGIVSLTGIVVNDGIVLIDAINQERRTGTPVGQAIRQASLGRFRPVLLTTITTIAGLLPLTLNVAEGGEFWVPLGVAIISGLLVSSALTLFVVPVLYSLLQDASAGGSFAAARQRLVDLVGGNGTRTGESGA